MLTKDLWLIHMTNGISWIWQVFVLICWQLTMNRMSITILIESPLILTTLHTQDGHELRLLCRSSHFSPTRHTQAHWCGSQSPVCHCPPGTGCLLGSVSKWPVLCLVSLVIMLNIMCSKTIYILHNIRSSQHVCLRVCYVKVEQFFRMS